MLLPPLMEIVECAVVKPVSNGSGTCQNGYSGFTVTELGLKVSIKYLNCKPVSHSHFLFQLVLRKFHSVCISFSGFLPCGFSCELADLSFILWIWFIAQQPKRNCIYIFFHKATYI